MGARAVETKRPNPCGLLVGKIQNIAGVCTGVVLIIAGSLALRAARKIKRGRRSPYSRPPRFRGKFKLSTYQAFLVAIYFILAGASVHESNCRGACAARQSQRGHAAHAIAEK